MDDTDDIRAQVGVIESEYFVAQEWGLFVVNPSTAEKNEAGKDLEKRLSAALTACQATPPDLVKAHAALVEARGILAGEKNKNIAYWSGLHLGLIPILLTIASTAAVYFLIFCDFRRLSNTTIFHDPAFWGLLGAVLKSFYWMQYQINRAMFRPLWLASFLVGPLVGTLLGGVVSVTLIAGAHLITGTDGLKPEWHAISLVAFYSGFKWQWALQTIEAGAAGIISRLKATK